jgi:putative Mn2+ efflux pump MntP
LMRHWDILLESNSSHLITNIDHWIAFILLGLIARP